MEEEKKMCPLLGNDCIRGRCAWYATDAEGTCAMYSVAGSLRNLDFKSVSAADLMETILREGR